eukprot:104653-Pyramimonas_sp.AAC.1
MSSAIGSSSLKRRLDRASAVLDAACEAGPACSEPPRGPLRRRIDRVSGQPSQPDNSLPLNRVLLRRWANGDLSSAAV